MSTIDQIALDTVQAIAGIDPDNLKGGKGQAMAQAQCLVIDAMKQAGAQDMRPIALKKLSQMGATVHGVLAKNEAGRWVAVSEAGRVMWLDNFEGRDSSVQPEQPSAGVVPEAKEIIDRVVEGLENGFVRCERCGDQEDTATLDCMIDLKRLQSLLTAAPTAPAVPNEQGKNRYGLDMAYFRKLFNRELLRPLVDFRPDELARVLARAARTADASVLQEPEFNVAQAVQGGGVPDKKLWSQVTGRDGKMYTDGWNDAIEAVLASRSEVKAVGVIEYADHQNADALTMGAPLRMVVAETSPRSLQSLSKGTKLYTHPHNGEQGGEWVDDRLHWYALSYRGKCLKTGREADAVTYTGYPENVLTKARIQQGKVDAGVNDKAVLVSATYCGHMTKADFTAQPPKSKEDRGHE